MIDQDDDFLTFVCISDTHSQHDLMPPLPKGDILLHTGDFTLDYGTPEELNSFATWIEKQDFKHKIIIAGNHEITFDVKREAHYKKTWPNLKDLDFAETKKLLTDKKTFVYLEDSFTIVEGIKIYGTPYNPICFDYGFQREESELKEIYEKIPVDSDIVMTHTPPHGILDKCNSGDIAGSPSLRDILLNKVNNKVSVFGHIHEAHGKQKIGEKLFLNSAIVDTSQPPHVVKSPYVFKMNKKTKEVVYVSKFLGQ